MHICLDDRRVALRGRGHRSLFPVRCRLVDECSDDGTTRHRCPGAGDGASPMRATASLRSRQPIHQRAIYSSGSWPIMALSARRAGRETFGTTQRWRASSRHSKPSAQRASCIARGMRPRQTCSITSSASTIQNAGTSGSVT